jgi:ferredoxin-NADP reductase
MAVNKETVLEVKHWSDKTFSFRTTRKFPNKFNNGEFAMIGMEHEGKKIMRAYSFASANLIIYCLVAICILLQLAQDLHLSWA